MPKNNKMARGALAAAGQRRGRPDADGMKALRLLLLPLLLLLLLPRQRTRTSAKCLAGGGEGRGWIEELRGERGTAWLERTSR